MRKVVEPFTLAVLGILIALTIHALYGSDRLPSRIPLHFDASGQPTSWGSPTVLLLLPFLAITIFLLLTVVTIVPSAFTLPVKVTVKNAVLLQALACDMVAWLKLEFISLFAWMQWAMIHVARHPEMDMPALMVPAALVAVFATVTFYIATMFRVEWDSLKH